MFVVTKVYNSNWKKVSQYLAYNEQKYPTCFHGRIVLCLILSLK